MISFLSISSMLLVGLIVSAIMFGVIRFLFPNIFSTSLGGVVFYVLIFPVAGVLGNLFGEKVRRWLMSIWQP